MRQAGTISNKHDADRFANYLLTLGISSKVDRADDAWAIWIHDENQVPRSRQELDLFEREPTDPRYDAAEHEAKVARRQAAAKAKQAKKNYVDLRNEWASPWRRRPVTMTMIVASVITLLGGSAVEQELMFSPEAIAAGEVWRLITPIFVHVNLWHLVFNMWWLYDLGTLIERRHGSWRFAIMVLVIALVSNVSEFVVSGPMFAGMSGVVYGLFGYAWVRGRLNPTSGLYLRPDVAVWMMAWFALCFVLPGMNVANTAHAAGLACGAAIGAIVHGIHLWQRNKNT